MNRDAIATVQAGFYGVEAGGVDVDQQDASAQVEQLFRANATYPAGTPGDYKGRSSP